MSIYETLPEDLREQINSTIYKLNLPKVHKKMLKGDELLTTKKATKKLLQICTIKAFDKKSRDKKVLKLTYMFKIIILMIECQHDNSWRKKIVGKENQRIFFCIMNYLMSNYMDDKIIYYFKMILKDAKMENLIEGTIGEKSIEDINQILYTLNENNLISNEVIDFIIYDIVNNNVSKICTDIHKQLKEWVSEF